MKPNGYRQFNTAYIGIVKKQGKSELAAAVALLLTCDDFEQVEKCMDMLRTDQASIVFDELFAQPNQRLYDVILHGLGDVSKQPLYCLITIAENDQHSICYKVHQIAKDVL